MPRSFATRTFRTPPSRRRQAETALERRSARRTRLWLEALEDRAVPAVLSTFLTTEHVDLNIGHTGGATGTWSLQPRDDDHGGVSYPPDVALLYVGDNAQSRVSRPASPSFDFIGVPPGDPFYRLPQSQDPELLYLGFAGYGVTPADFDRYNPSAESKGRVSGLGRWLKVSLVEVKHFTPDGQPGSGKFSVWQSGDTGPNVLISNVNDGVSNPDASGLDATDGISADDALWIVAGGHIHYNWGFTEKGRYEVKVRLSGYLNDGNTTDLGQLVESDPITLYFSVGSVGQLAFDASTYQVNEAAGTASITVRRTGGSDGRIAVNYATSDGSATAGADYTSTSGTLTFDDQETSKTITIPITDDLLIEGDEVLNLTLSGAGPASIHNYLIDHQDDANGLLGTQVTATLTILDNDVAGNSPPTITDLTDRTIDEDGSTGAIAFTVGDAETAAGSLVVTAASSNASLVAAGNVVIGGGGASRTVTVTPAANQFGTATITLTVTDGGGLTATDTFVLTVNPIDDAPTAGPQGVVTDEDTAKAITLAGSDVENAPLTFVIVSGPTNGTLSGTGASRTYTPAANFNGADSFTFKVNDGSLDSATVTVSITVNPINDAPTADPQNVVTDEDTAKPLTLTGSDVENSPLSFVIVTAPAHGTLSGTAPNLTYTPNAGYEGPDSFTFKVNDGSLDSAVATVSITVAGVEGPPTLSDITDRTIDEDGSTGPLAFTVGDAETAAGTLVVVASSSNPTLVPAGGIVLGGSGASRTVTITPAANQSGTATITLTVTDAAGLTATEAFVLTVNAVNDAPVASPQAVSTDEDAAKPITLIGSDVENSALTFAVVSAPANGTLSGTAPNLTYTPAANFQGTDSFTFKVNDGALDSATVTVTITVNAVNDAPTANAQGVATDENTAKAITLTGSDVEGAALSFVIVSGPVNGTLSGTAPNLTYTPNAGYEGPDSFTFKVNDGSLDSAVATVSITVSGVNGTPVISPVADLAVDEDASSEPIAFTVGDAETAAENLVVTASSSNASLVPAGNVVLGGSGASRTVNVTPAANQFGMTTITLTVTDGAGLTAIATFTVTVRSVNDPPTVSTIGDVVMDEDGDVTIPFTVGDVETAAGSLTVTRAGSNSVLLPTSRLTLGGGGADRTLRIRPNPNQSGEGTVTVTVRDAGGATTTATFKVTVRPVDDAPIASDDSVFAAFGSTTTLPDLLANDRTLDQGQTLALSSFTQGSDGTVAPAAGGLLSYTPRPGFRGFDAFTYTIVDDDGDTATATVTVAVGVVDLVHTDMYVNYVNGEWYSNIKADFDARVFVDSDEAVLFANPSSKLTLPALPPSFSFLGAGEGDDVWLLPQSQDSSMLWLGFSNEGTPIGALASSVRLDLAYFSGPGHFSVFDIDAIGNPRVAIDTADGVNSADDAATGGNSADFYTVFVRSHSHVNWAFTQPGRYVVGLRATALVNATDAEGNPIQVSSTGPVALLYFDVNELTGIPLGENPPIARDDSAAAVEDGGPATVLVLANDSPAPDPDEALAVTGVTQGAHGAVTVAGDGKSVIYTPLPNFSGTDSFTYTITDEHGGTATATVTMNVAAAPDAPSAADDAYAVSDGNTARGNVLFNDRDVDGDPLTASLLGGPAHGSATLAPDGSFTYTPGPSFAGLDAFTYTITDPSGATATATVTVTAAGFRDFEAIVTEGHTDVGIAFEDGAWDLHVHDEEHDAEYEPSSALLYVGPQAERLRPAGAEFDFLGIGPGETFWELPHSPPNPELILLGIGTEEIEEGTFRDGRVRIHLKSVNGPGHFSVWRSTDAGPQVFLSTADGITGTDLFEALTGGHEDLNWGFTARGRYEVTLEASGFLEDGDDIEDFSGEVTYIFSVDHLGRFQLDAPAYAATEGESRTITVRRVGGSDGPLTVAFAAGQGTATAGADFVPFAGTLTFADGETEKTFTVTALPDSAVEGDEVVEVVLSLPDGGQGQLGSPSLSTLTIVDDDRPSDLSVTTTASPASVLSGDELTFTVRLANDGPGDAHGVSLTDVVPGGTTFVSAAAPAGWTIAAPAAGQTGSVVFAKPTVAGGEAATFTIVVRVTPNSPLRSITNTAVASSDTPDPDPDNNASTTTTPIRMPVDVGVTKTVSPTPVATGGLLTFTVTVSNHGSSPAPDVRLYEILPDKTTLVSISNLPGWTIVNPPAGGPGGVITATTSSLAAGASATFTVVVRVRPGTKDGAILNSRSVVSTSAVEVNQENNSVRTSTTVFAPTQPPPADPGRRPLAPAVTAPRVAAPKAPSGSAAAALLRTQDLVLDRAGGLVADVLRRRTLGGWPGLGG